MTPTDLIQKIVGFPVSHVWRGYGSAILIELGQLKSRVNQRTREPFLEGQATLMIEWSWRIERPKSILCGSWSDERRWPKALAQLVGARVSAVECVGHLPEIRVSLNNGLRVLSFMTAEGQPQWAIVLRRPKYYSVHVSRGRLIMESGGVA